MEVVDAGGAAGAVVPGVFHFAGWMIWKLIGVQSGHILDGLALFKKNQLTHTRAPFSVPKRAESERPETVEMQRSLSVRSVSVIPVTCPPTGVVPRMAGPAVFLRTTMDANVNAGAA